MPPAPLGTPETTPPTASPVPEIQPVPLRWGRLLLALAVIVAALAGLFFYRTSEVAPVANGVSKKIGIANFRQGESSIEGLKKGLADLGYTDIQYDQQEIEIGPNTNADMRAAIERMVRDDHVDLFFADHEQQALMALQVTADLGIPTPIVYLARFHDPVEFGLAASYKSSGNNATGVAQNLADTVARNLEFVVDMEPSVKKIGIFGKGFVIPDIGGRYFDEFKKQAQEQGFQVVEYTTDRPPEQSEAAWHQVAATIKPGDIDALFHVPGHFYGPQETAEYELARTLGIPHSVPVEDMPGGGDFSYSADFRAAGAQAARIVDKIFHGTAPSDIPVEYGEKSILILNEKRAAESGLTFPSSMVYLADQFISATSSAQQ